MYLLSGTMSLHHLAIMTKPSLSCLLCMLAIPIFPFLKFTCKHCTNCCSLYHVCVRVFTTVLEALGTAFSPSRCADLTPAYVQSVRDTHHCIAVLYMEIHVHSTLAKEYNGRKVIPTQTNKATHIKAHIYMYITHKKLKIA